MLLKQESVCKTGNTPPQHTHTHTHYDLDLHLNDPKINREHLLSMTNVCMKFEKAERNKTLGIDRTWLYMTDRQTERRTDGHVQSNIPLLLRRGGGGAHKN